MKNQWLIIIMLSVMGCSKAPLELTPTPVKTIIIQPLGDVLPEYIALVKKSTKSFYGYNCVVKSKKEIVKDMLTRFTKRIDAKKALMSNKSNNYLLLLTEKDICHFKDKNRPEYGIYGLGAINGKTCIISTFRLQRGVSKYKALERLEKVVLHEIGHNLGLKHCVNNKICMMNDAKGTIKQVDQEKVWLCEKCWNLIKNN
jgi:archaemetzincin